MVSHPDQEVREAVIKLETKMESMASSYSSMATAVEKLASSQQGIQTSNAVLMNMLSQKNEESKLAVFTLNKRMDEACITMTERVNTLHSVNSNRVSGIEKKLWWALSTILGVAFLEVVSLILDK